MVPPQFLVLLRSYPSLGMQLSGTVLAWEVKSLWLIFSRDSKIRIKNRKRGEWYYSRDKCHRHSREKTKVISKVGEPVSGGGPN